jgi:hypothetical protein
MSSLGYVFISSSGNDGPFYSSINYPGVLDEVITVGSIDPFSG